MAKRSGGKKPITGRIVLDGGEEVTERPELALHALGAQGEVLASADVSKDGRFSLDAAAVEDARRVVVTGKGGDPSDRAQAYSLRPQAFHRAVEAGELAISDHHWVRFLSVRRCVDARIRRCFPWRFVLDDLVARIRALPPAIGAVEATPWFPLHRCAPVCVGDVEVYRRTCCCRPWVVEPPVDLPELPQRPPFPFPGPLPDPFPEPVPGLPFPLPPPGPGPDPAPFALQDAVLSGGTLDAAKVERLRAGVAPAQAQAGILFPRCECGPAKKVGGGFVGEGGRIHVCWREPLRLHRRHCHDEYAFVVRQHVAGSTVTIYDGVAAGQWFDAGDDDVVLTSYHPRAVACREDEFPVPVEGAFVLLQELGSTDSHQLRTPLPDGPDSVGTPAADSGLLDLGTDHALGGNVHLRYHFSEIAAGADMQELGARYFRVRWAPADALGDPAGPWETLPVPAWETWRVDGTDIVPGNHALGPHTVDGEHDLFHIPFETGAPLGLDEEWQDGQFHAVVPTDTKPEGRYLVRIEVFDGAGNRLEPAAEPFTYRRWDTETSTLPVTHGALTHLVRTDNRPVVADIADVTGPGAAAGDCKFFVGDPTQAVTIAYRAFHPEPGTPSFMKSYSLAVRRGISGSVATPPLSSTAEAGESGLPAAHAVTIGDLLDGEDKCSFAVNLHVTARIHNGSGRLSNLDRQDVAAFAVELSP